MSMCSPYVKRVYTDQLPFNVIFKNFFRNFFPQIFSTQKVAIRGSIMRTEKHHILPRRLGGTDEPSNLTRVTLPEHALYHINNAKTDRFGKDNNEGEWYSAALIWKRMNFMEDYEFSMLIDEATASILSNYNA